MRLLHWSMKHSQQMSTMHWINVEYFIISLETSLPTCFSSGCRTRKSSIYSPSTSPRCKAKLSMLVITDALHWVSRATRHAAKHSCCLFESCVAEKCCTARSQLNTAWMQEQQTSTTLIIIKCCYDLALQLEFDSSINRVSKFSPTAPAFKSLDVTLADFRWILKLEINV